MSRVSAGAVKILRSAVHREVGGTVLGLGRSLVALAELSVIAFTPDRALFAVTADLPSGISCAGLKAASLWCVGAGPAHGMVLARVTSILVLTLVASGFRPRWTCLPHLYIAFSVSASITEPNGGDRFSEVAALLLAPICLSDGRVWQWIRPRRLPSPCVQGSAYAAVVVIRIQVLIIYVGAASAKLADPAWRGGTALQIIMHDPDFGAPAFLRQYLTSVLNGYWPLALVTWAVIAMEMAIGVGMNLTWRWRRRAMLGGAALHASIILMLGLPSFGLVMIGFLMIAEGDRPIDPGSPMLRRGRFDAVPAMQTGVFRRKTETREVQHAYQKL